MPVEFILPIVMYMKAHRDQRIATPVYVANWAVVVAAAIVAIVGIVGTVYSALHQHNVV